MLQFWKKSGSRESTRPRSTPSSPARHAPSSPATPSPISPGPSSPTLHNGESNCTHAALLARLEEEEPTQTDDSECLLQDRSRLSMSLAEVIADKGALGYFIQFLEAHGSGAFIRFWLDAECFRSAAQEDARVGRHSGHSKSDSVPFCDTVHSAVKNNKSEETKDCVLRTGYEVHESVGASVRSDAVRIFEKYLGVNATHPVPVDDSVKSSVAFAVCQSDALDPECFTPAQAQCFSVMEDEYFNEFLRSDFYCKHQIDVLTSGDVGLIDILYNQTSLFYFMEFMEQEGHRGLLEFWLAANNFASHLVESGGSLDAEQAQNDAIILYDKFFSLQATCPLGFGDKLRVEVEHNICHEGGPQPTCFSRSVRIVIKLLSECYLQPFLQSQLYFKYLSELINTIQATKPGSDSGSEIGGCSSVTSNTLLASSDMAPPRKVLRNLDHQNLSIDSRQLYDPDTLWRRRHHSGLSFGRINELGRFETEVEPEPDKKTGELGSRLTRAMKKLVNMDEDKAKEEMAWQIAEMIVKDVTNLTLCNEPIS